RSSSPQNESGSIEWVKRCRHLTEERDWLKSVPHALALFSLFLLLTSALSAAPLPAAGSNWTRPRWRARPSAKRCRSALSHLSPPVLPPRLISFSSPPLVSQARRLQRQLKTQEEDREFLIKQLVAVKKENAKLRHPLEQVTRHAAPMLLSA